MWYNSPEPTHLADHNGALVIECEACGRRGVFHKPRDLVATIGNPPLEDIPRITAIRGGCKLAAEKKGAGCGARIGKM